MHPTTRLLALVLALALFPAHAHGAWLQGGSRIASSPRQEQVHAICPDGLGGTFVAWAAETPAGSGLNQVYLQHVDADGEIHAGWPAAGMLISNGGGNTDPPLLVPSYEGSVWVIWADPGRYDSDIAADRVWSDGSRDFGAYVLFVAQLPIPERWPVARPDGGGGFYCLFDDGYGHLKYQHIDSAGDVTIADPNGIVVVTPGAGRGAYALAVGTYLYAVWADARMGNQDMYVQRFDASGHLPFLTPIDGYKVCTAAGDQTLGEVITEGLGGDAIITWSDPRYSPDGVQAQVYGQRFSSGGAMAWAADGVLLLDMNYPMGFATLADGGGGFYVTRVVVDLPGFTNGVDVWRFSGSGTLAFPWLAGRRISNSRSAAAENDYLCEPVPDGAGGIVQAWFEANDYSLWCNRLRPGGDVAAGWPATGRRVTGTLATFRVPLAAALGSGNVVLAWPDGRDGTSYDDYAQVVRSNGLTGAFDATLGGVSDARADQGGAVRLAVTGASADSGLGEPYVSGYNVWRLVPAGVLAGGSVREVTGDQAAARVLRATWEPVTLTSREARAAGLPAGTWESLGFHAATRATTYLFSAPTRNDSGPAGPANETFVVTVHATDSPAYSVTGTATGHSVDNLAPGAPQNLAAAPGPGTLVLTWNANAEGDLAGYEVHRGVDPSFTPSNATRIGAPAAPAFTDAAPVAGSTYKVAAMDRHGNASAYATTSPVTGVGDAAPDFLAPPTPNPFGEAAVLAFGLRQPGPVSIEIFDLAGRRVITLARGTRAAGRHEVRWAGHDERGREVARGLYLVRMRAGALEQTVKLACMR